MRLNERFLNDLALQALKEDAAYQDITTLDFIPKDARVEARVVSGDAGVACGLCIARTVFSVFDKGLAVVLKKKDGDAVRKGQTLISLKGRARSVLSSERSALNFIGWLSGIATETRKALDAVKGSGIRILDTRKTTPLMRSLEKYAVKAGGGDNHRFDLSEQYLVKDNHLQVLKDTIGNNGLLRRRKKVPFEIEVESLAELRQVICLQPAIIMLDNFTPAAVRAAIRLLSVIYKGRKKPLIELSGGISPGNISRYSIKGVDFISLGCLTHSAPALDVSLEIMRVY